MKRSVIFALLVLSSALACAEKVQAPRAPVLRAEPVDVTMQFDFGGVEAILAAIERESLSERDVDALVRIHGVRAMVDNVTRFVPGRGMTQFRADVETFARKKKGTNDDDVFQLSDVWSDRKRVREFLSKIRAEEKILVHEILSLLEPYRPATGPLAIRVYFVAGGVSDGFALENDVTAFYVNLARSDEYYEVIANMLHEAYHVMQMVAQKRAGTFTAFITDDRVPMLQRVLAGTLMEGTANFVADPARLTAPKGMLKASRARFAHAAESTRINENFAVFDEVVADIREGSISWPEITERGFSRSRGNEDRFYFVGYEMAKAIDQYCGARCLADLVDAEPVAFFREYVELYRKHPEIRGRFDKATESILMNLPAP